jgi:hypothetical protein
VWLHPSLKVATNIADVAEGKSHLAHVGLGGRLAEVALEGLE